MDYRLKQHPILSIPEREKINLYWNSQQIDAYKGETISAALSANGIRIFGYHSKDHAPQGIFCANGQCAQCMVLVDGKPVKACVELVQEEMHIQPLDGLPVLPNEPHTPVTANTPVISVDVLIIGGGPAGLSAALELGKLGVKTLLVDDKHRLGGKLVLQTHRFFGSTQAVYAGARGIDIATRLENELKTYESITVWVNSTALAIFSDQKIGILKDGCKYFLITPKVILVASGAREKFLVFPGNTLPGVFGAGAFQTLVNRDLIQPSKRLFIIGGGNVGLIAGYHALQAGIQVIGLVEALPECGGYKVHKDKLARLGVPIFTSHTILSANGRDGVESITIAEIDDKFETIIGTERTYECDSILVAVGLDPVDEFYHKAKEYQMNVFAAGDAQEIAEASAAIYSGKIKGVEIAHSLGYSKISIPQSWVHLGEILKSKPGSIVPEKSPTATNGVFPIIHCTQEIPCDPCSENCSKGLLFIDRRDIRSIPIYKENLSSCTGCGQCIISCPGLAITLVDYRADMDHPTVSVPFELCDNLLKINDLIDVQDTEGNSLGLLPIQKIILNRKSDKTRIIKVKAPKEIAQKIAGIRIPEKPEIDVPSDLERPITDEAIVCRCERITAKEIRELIRKGMLDMNEIKTVSRAGMGACGSKTCGHLIQRLFREEGISGMDITPFTSRPLFIETPLGVFAGCNRDGE